MTINVSGRMARKSTTRDLNGQIINMVDEANGGYIIRNRQIVNPEMWQEHLKKEQDKRDAAKAMTAAKVDPAAPDRVIPPNAGKIDVLEKRMDEQDAKLDAILAALSKK
jgi:hypothetical protein